MPQDRFPPFGMARRDKGQRVGKHLGEAFVRRRRDHLLAFVGRGGDPHLPPRGDARELGQFAPIGRQRRRVELDVAGDEDVCGAKRGQSVAVVLAARQAHVEVL